MPSTILDNVKGSDLPKIWADKIDIIPDETYTVIIQPQEERLSLQKIMSKISRNAKTRGMTPDVLENILGEKIKHIL
ncbi:MAG: hypothetical protein KAU38_12260 [Desulfobacterales bacterium]|nr:hypothetical protein [Desulfobacterales bacterium]